jgi:hypothetical protein
LVSPSNIPFKSASFLSAKRVGVVEYRFKIWRWYFKKTLEFIQIHQSSININLKEG